MFQVKPPLDSRHCKTEGSNELKIKFPPFFEYQSEGRSEILVCKERERTVNFMLNKTEFSESRIRIWHLTIVSRDEPVLNEFEIIKLIGLYDGRSEDTGPYKKHKHPNKNPENDGSEIKIKPAAQIKFLLIL